MKALLQIMIGVVIVSVGISVSHGIAIEAISEGTTPWSRILGIGFLVTGIYVALVAEYNSARAYKKILDSIPTHEENNWNDDM